MKDIFFADAHLLNPVNGNYRRLLAFLADQRGQIRHLVMLGDIFDFWLGYRHTVFAPFVPLLDELRRQREAGAKLIFVEGNHDFHMGPFFSEFLDCRILPDGGELLLDDRRVFLAHGDLINPDDKAYHLLRKALRSPLSKALLPLVPPDWAWSIALRASRKSAQKKGRRTAFLPEKTLLAFADQRFLEGYDTVITGHFHVPLFRRMGDKTVIALGDWIEQDSYALFENGVFTLERA